MGTRREKEAEGEEEGEGLHRGRMEGFQNEEAPVEMAEVRTALVRVAYSSYPEKC